MSSSAKILELLNDADCILTDYTIETGCSKDDCEIYEQCIEYLGDEIEPYDEYESFSDALEIICGKIDGYLSMLHSELLRLVIDTEIEEGFVLDIIEKFLDVYKYDFKDTRKGPFGIGEVIYDYLKELRIYIKAGKMETNRREEMNSEIVRLVADSELPEKYKEHLNTIVEEMFV